MTGFTKGALLALGLVAIPSSVSVADRPGQDAADVADRDLVAKQCEIFIHDGLEALADRRLPEAERWLKQARAEAEKLGPESLAMAHALGALGALSLVQDEHAEAEAFLARSLTIKEKTLGPDDPG